jgi:hypothetical protein
MILHGQLCGNVGRRRDLHYKGRSEQSRAAFLFSWELASRTMGTAIFMFRPTMENYLSFALLFALGMPHAFPDDSRCVAELFQQLQQPSSTDQSAAELLKIGRGDTNAKPYLAKHLSDIIGKTSTNRYVWLNSVRLAGAFRITEAIQALGENISCATEESSVGGITSRYRLVGFPCGRALVEIGEPAVPELTKILNSDDLSRQWIAYRALFLIGTSRAMVALRDYARTEPNEAFKTEIKIALENWKPPSPGHHIN